MDPRCCSTGKGLLSACLCPVASETCISSFESRLEATFIDRKNFEGWSQKPSQSHSPMSGKHNSTDYSNNYIAVGNNGAAAAERKVLTAHLMHSSMPRLYRSHPPGSMYSPLEAAQIQCPSSVSYDKNLAAQRYICHGEQTQLAAYCPGLGPRPQVPSLYQPSSRMLVDAGYSSSGDFCTPALLIGSPAYYLQSACTPESKHQASTRPLEAQTSTETTNGYSSLDSTSAASDVFPVLSHHPKGNLATQFSSKTVAHPYNHHDIDFNRQPCREQTPAGLFSVSKPNDEPRITSAQVQCWDHGCNGKRFSTMSNLFRHEREKKGLGANAVCTSCGTRFSRTTALKDHIENRVCSKFQGESKVG